MRKLFGATALALVALLIGVTPAGAATAALPSTTGSWSLPFVPPGGPTPGVIGVHSVLLHTGKVLLFGRTNPTIAYVFDPATRTSVEVDPPANMECAAVVPLADGRILAVGGIAAGNVGIKNILLFDPVTLTWTAQPPTPLGRYYPTATRLANGTVVISGGTTVSGAPNNTVEVFTPPAPGSTVGTLTRVSDHVSTIYARQYLMPDGKVLEVTGGKASLLDPHTWLWTPLPSPARHGTGQTFTLLPGSPAGSTRVMVAGGLTNATGHPAMANAETFDEANPAAGWKSMAPLPQARAHMAAAWTPDGKLIGVGGNNLNLFDGGVHPTLSYDPVANVWTTMATQTERRAYHSTAVLLPDGRVLSAGDTGPGGGGTTLEIFSPPYLFKGAAPALTSAPNAVANGSAFTIAATAGSRAVLMSPGASTHTADMDGRIISLAQTVTTGGMKVTAPAPNVAPPGWYMLFVVGTNGVPSTAHWIHLG